MTSALLLGGDGVMQVVEFTITFLYLPLGLAHLGMHPQSVESVLASPLARRRDREYYSRYGALLVELTPIGELLGRVALSTALVVI